MRSVIPNKLVLFDLDGTLFDHYHSLRSAIATVQEKYEQLAHYQPQDLIARYNVALQQAYDKYLHGEIQYDDTDNMKVELFFTELGFPKPSIDEIKAFRQVYKPAYRENRRSTPGSIETLARLREHDFRLAIVTNGQVKDQAEKAEAIGVHHLVDRILTSQEIGHPKPDIRLFQAALEAFPSQAPVHMVGDSIGSDVKGALEAQLSAILYSPIMEESEQTLFGQRIPVIHHMTELLPHLGIPEPHFEPNFTYISGKLIIENLGIDLVTEPRYCMQISKDAVISLAESMARVLGGFALMKYGSSMDGLEYMIRAIAKVAAPIDETAIEISYPGQGQGEPSSSQFNCIVTRRVHSVRAEYRHLVLTTHSDNEKALRDVAVLLQAHCNDLMRDYQRAAIRCLRSAMLITAEKAGITADTIIRGATIDE